MMRRLRYLFEIFREDLQIKTNFVICSFTSFSSMMKLTTSLRMTSCLLKTIKNPIKCTVFKQLSNLRNASQSEFSPSKIDWPKEMSDELESSFEVINDFINEAEESDLMKEVEPHLKRLVYEKDHWDEAIVGFRETERKQWNQVNSVIIDKLRKAAFKPKDKYLPYVHVLDLAEDGHIKPHIDSPRVKLLFSSFARNIDKKNHSFFSFAVIQWLSLVCSLIAL